TESTLGAALWLAAVLLSLPMFIATFRKLQALGLLLAETKVTAAAAGERTAAIRSVVAQVVPIAGIIALGLFVFVLNSAPLPAFNVLLGCSPSWPSSLGCSGVRSSNVSRQMG